MSPERHEKLVIRGDLSIELWLEMGYIAFQFALVMKLPLGDYRNVDVEGESYHRVSLHGTLIPNTGDNHFQILDSPKEGGTC